MNNLPEIPRVLLIEDEESVREAIKFTLESWCDVTPLSRTMPAIELLKKESFDIVLLDIVIRGEGEEGSLNLLKLIKKKYPKLPVIVLSGSVTWMSKWHELKELGACGYLSKPFDKDKADEIIKRCISGEKMDTVW